MTKVRPPLTIENALLKVLGLIGIEKAAEVTERSQDYLRSVSDHDSRYRLSVDDGIKLDLAYHAAGGDGYPIHEAYTLLLGVAVTVALADAASFHRQTLAVLKEGGEAHVALVAANAPNATRADTLIAIKECEEGLTALTRALSILSRRAASEDPP